MGIYNLISLGGIIALMAIAWLFSTNHRKINVRVIVFGVGLQLALALLVFRSPGSHRTFLWLNDTVLDVFESAKAGQVFLFGSVADPSRVGFILAFQALPLAIFFSALMALLYHWRVMPLIIRGFSWVFSRLMRISGAESLCAASNIFVGVESATAVRPHLPTMTRSEFCTILTAGMATVASTTLGIYVSMLSHTFETIAGHLISASILSAPAAIVMSKLLVPETEQPRTLGRAAEFHTDKQPGSVAAIITGAMAGVKLVVGICALLIAFLGLLALANLILGGVGGWFGAPSLSIQMVLGYVFYPLAIVIGVPPTDAAEVGRLLGERFVATEIPAYKALADNIASGAFSPRTVVVTAYALCGFAHVASMAIFAGGISALVPERRKDIAAVAPRALLAATLACLMTGAVAGVFFDASDTIIQVATQPAP